MQKATPNYNITHPPRYPRDTEVTLPPIRSNKISVRAVHCAGVRPRAHLHARVMLRHPRSPRDTGIHLFRVLNDTFVRCLILRAPQASTNIKNKGKATEAPRKIITAADDADDHRNHCTGSIREVLILSNAIPMCNATRLRINASFYYMVPAQRHSNTMLAQRRGDVMPAQ